MNDQEPKKISFLLTPRSKEEQHEQGTKVANYCISKLGYIEGLIAIRQLLEMLNVATETVKSQLLENCENGEYKKFGAVLKIFNQIDKYKIPKIIALYTDKKNQIKVIEEQFKLAENEILSNISSLPRKRIIQIFFKSDLKSNNSVVSASTKNNPPTLNNDAALLLCCSCSNKVPRDKAYYIGHECYCMRCASHFVKPKFPSPKNEIQAIEQDFFEKCDRCGQSCNVNELEQFDDKYICPECVYQLNKESEGKIRCLYCKELYYPDELDSQFFCSKCNEFRRAKYNNMLLEGEFGF